MKELLRETISHFQTIVQYQGYRPDPGNLHTNYLSDHAGSFVIMSLADFFTELLSDP